MPNCHLKDHPPNVKSQMANTSTTIAALEAALINSTGINGIVMVELGSCPATYTYRQIATLVTLPILIVFGDHLDTPTGIPGLSTV